MTDAWKIYCVWHVTLLLLISNFPGCSGSHFRGGIIMWKPTGIKNEVEIHFRISWRKSFSGRTQCNNDVIAAGTYIGPAGSYLDCFYGCHGQITSMDYKCTDFSIQEDWSAGEKSYKYTFPEDIHHYYQLNHYYQFGFTGNAWITLVSGGSSWELRATANLTERSDTGKVNSSPVSAMEPIVKIQHECNSTIEIPVHDDDGDIVRCRWSESSKNECAGVCHALPGANLDEGTCKLFYSAIGQNGWYAVAVQIEDFAQENDTEPLSSVPLQFLVNVFRSNDQCANSPEFVYPTRIAGSCIGVPFNTTFFETLIARSGSNSTSIVEINTVSPAGMYKSDIAPYGNTNREWYVNVTWTPAEDQKGINIFCFTAVDSASLSSPQSCITLLGGVKAPEIANGSLSPIGDILPSNRAWSLAFDMKFVQPTRSTFIYFYKSNGTLVHKIDVSKVNGYPQGLVSQIIAIDLRLPLKEKEHYYILMDPGVAIGTTYCGAESPAITDTSFWNVRIRDITPPRLLFIHNPSVTNANVTISWQFDEDVSTKCTIQTPSALSIEPCNDTWTGLDLVEGYYTIYIQGIDIENNAGDLEMHTWRVDRTPPEITFFNIPPDISNKTSLVIEFGCNENCTTHCTLHQIGTHPVFTPCGVGQAWKMIYFSTGTLHTDIRYVFGIKATDSAANQGDVRTVEWRTDFIAPIIHQLNTVTVSCGSDYSPNTTGTPNVTDNLDPDPIIMYSDEAANQCGILRVWTATDAADNTANMQQEIKFTSPRPATVKFPKMSLVPCGDLDLVTRSILIPSIRVDHPCGLPVKITYKDPYGANPCGEAFNRNWSVTDDCGGLVNHLQQIKVLDPQVPLTPYSGQTNIDLHSTLRWPVYPNSVWFKVYLWNAMKQKPLKPVTVTSKPEYSVSTALQPGAHMIWQIEFVLKNNETIPGPQWGFQTRKYPDVTVERIIVPPLAFSGQSFAVRWRVRNIGNLTTQTYRWYDAVFISFVDDFRSARRALYVRQNNILVPNDGYTGNALVRLNDDDIGKLHVFVQTDTLNQISELDRSNNILKASDVIDVKLTPPPDLRVDTIVIPSSSYSGVDVFVTFTVKNHGTGMTRVNSWYDQILWSTDPFFNSSDVVLARVQRKGGLRPEQTYTAQITVTVPREIYGDFFIIVQTDLYQKVFEYTFDDNNIAVSDAIKIILSPPPDLRATQLQVGDSFTTGDDMHIHWQVDNDGTTPYQQTWSDRVILCSSDGGVTRELYTATFAGKLLHKHNYTRTFIYRVSPELSTGQYNITVYVDYRHEVFEFNKTDNNIKTNVLTITQALPDLTVYTLTTHLTSSEAGNDLNVSWVVRNIGNGKTLTSLWTDSILLRFSLSSIFTPYVWQFQHTSPLAANDTYAVSKSIRLPMRLHGNVYASLYVDSDRNTYDPNTVNNKKETGLINIPLKAPDLEIIQMQLTSVDPIYSGDSLILSWNASNIGVSIPTNAFWEDQIVLSPSYKSILPILGSVELRNQGPLKKGAKYQRKSAIQIPSSATGEMFLYITINSRHEVYEGQNLENNAKYLSLFIQNPPSPDLTVRDVTTSVVSTNHGSQRLLVVSWTVLNIGNSMRNDKNWFDAVYLSNNNATLLEKDETYLLFLRSFPVYASLKTHQTYNMKKYILLPSGVVGKYFVSVATDSYGSIVELNGEDNNMARSKLEIEIDSPPVPKLSVNFISITSKSNYSLETCQGKNIWIHFEVSNTGDKTRSKTSWTDVVYLLNIENADIQTVVQNGIKVATVPHIGILHPSESYTLNKSVCIPHDFSGNAYFYLLADVENNGNRRTSAFSSSDLTSINHGMANSPKVDIFTGRLPNIFPSIASNVAEQRGGEPYVLQYNMTNNGEEITNGLRYDAVYLSDDIILDPFDRLLKTQSSLVSLDVNQTVNASVDIFLPLDLVCRNYFLILVVDTLNSIYELDEADNTAYQALTVKESMRSDIAVVDVEAPANASFGNKMQVSWKLINNGSEHTSGYICDTAYVSADDKWDINDEQIGKTTCSFITIGPNAADNIPSSIKSEVPLVADGQYTTVVKTRSNILDYKMENNVGSANHTTNISIAKIFVDNSVTFNYSFYKRKAFLIPNVPRDETLIVAVTRKNDQIPVKIRLRFGKPATDYAFDVTSKETFLPNQTVVQPNTKEGDYYILIVSSGQISNSLSATEMKVEVKIAKFEILRTVPAKASVTGNVTLMFEGTLFPEDVKAELLNNNRSLNALQVFHFSSTLVYATFDMTKAVTNEILSASLSSKSLNLTTTLHYVLEIIDGISGKIKASVSLPSSLRPGEKELIAVDVENVGDADILAPVIAVTTNKVGHIKLLTKLKSTDYKQRYVIVASPAQGPGGILQPKGYSRLFFNVKQINPEIIGKVQISVALIEPDDGRPHEYMGMKDILKFSYYDDYAWNRVWRNFIEYAGTTWSTLTKKVSDISNQLSVAGRRIYELSDFVFFLLDMSDSPNKDNVIIKNTDIRLKNTKFSQVGLEMQRFISPKLGLRNTNSFFGKGWINPLWNTKLVGISPTVAKLCFDKIEYLFLSSGLGIYENNALGRMVIRNSGCYYTDKKSEMEYRFNISSGDLLSMTSNRDGSYIRLHFDTDHMISEVQHSSGAFMIISYDEIGRISKATLKNSTYGADQMAIYSYDSAENRLLAVTVNGHTTSYEYYMSDGIRSVLFPNGRREEFQYNSNGHLRSHTVVEQNQTLAKMVYAYDDNAQIATTVSPDNVQVSYTYNEYGNVAAAQRKGALKTRFVNTIDTRSVYEGDYVVTYERFESKSNSVHLEDGNGDSLELEYDRLGQVKLLKDGSSNIYQVERNENETLRKSIFPDKTEEQYFYRPYGFDIITRNGVTKQYNYDNAGRVVWKQFGDDDITSYQYDERGNILAASNKVGKVSFSYDKNSVMQTVTYPNDNTLHYAFSDKRIKAGINSSIGYGVKYVYNSKDLLTAVIDQETSITLMSAEYFETGKLKMKRLGNGAYTNYTYATDSGLLIGQYNYYPNSTLASKFEYNYDVRGRRIKIQTTEGEWNFRYDASGQVTYIERPDRHYTKYSYDASKNRNTVTSNGINKSYKINSMNQYLEYGSGDQEFEHDKNGNLILVNGTKYRKYKFDEENKLMEFKTAETRCSFLYDGIDSLYQKICQDETIVYITDPFGKNGPDILAELSSAGQNIYYYHGGDQLGLVAMKKDAKLYYYQFDPLGTVVALLNKDGELLNSYSLEPFGEIIHAAEAVKNPFKFIGQWGVVGFKEVPELFYMRARFYDAQHGRFLSADPLGISGGSKNFYAYAYNNPIHFNDPKGTFVNFIISGLINTGAYAGVQFLTGGKITLGGAASAFASGLIGGSATRLVTKIATNVLRSGVGTLTEHVVNNIKDDEPFSGKKLGGNVVNGIVQSFIPGVSSTTAKSILRNVGGFIFDPTKSPSEKWQQVKQTWQGRFNSAKDMFISDTKTLKDNWQKLQTKIQHQWDTIKDQIESPSHKIGESWQNIKEDLNEKVTDIEQTIKNEWDAMKNGAIDKWGNIKDEVEDAWTKITEKTKSDFKDLKDDIRHGLENVREVTGKEWDDFKHMMHQKWDKTKESMRTEVDKAINGLTNAYKKVQDRMRELEKGLEQEIDRKVQEVEEKWNDIKKALKNLESNIMDWIRSRDPNDMKGPLGYGAARFIAKTAQLNYRIRFENDPNATAPAQRVFIEHIFDSDLNPNAFKIGTFGFGSYIREIGEDSSYLQTNINLTESLGIFLRVQAGLDIVSKKATWELQSLDPSTGAPPVDPEVGFLPPNNGTTGQGFVSFSIKPLESARSLARIDAKASIYFDNNAPIDTPPVFNTIDDSAPSVNGSVIEEMLSSGSLALALNGYDIGAGLRDVDILVKRDVGYNTVMAAVNESAVVLPLPPGTYDFVFSPVDEVGNRQDLEDSVQSSRLKVYFPETTYLSTMRLCLNCTGPGICKCDYESYGNDFSSMSCVEFKNCSGNGNCTGPGICKCDDGFYGNDCSSDIQPIEPPILEMTSVGGYANEGVQLHVSAKHAHGNSTDNLIVEVKGFPNETTFNKGEFDNSVLLVQPKDFGSINVTFPRDFTENVRLTARAIYTRGNNTYIRTGTLRMAISPFNLSVSVDCLDRAMKSTEIDMNITTKFGATVKTDVIYLTIIIPSGYSLNEGQRVSDGYFILNQTEETASLKIIIPSSQSLTMFNVRVKAEVNKNHLPGAFVTKYADTRVLLCKAGTTAPEKTFTAALATTAGIQGAATSTAAFMTSREKDSGASYIYSKNAKSSTESGTATSGKQDKTTSIFAIMGGLGGFVILVLFAMVIRLSMAKRSKKHSDETGNETNEEFPLDNLGSEDYGSRNEEFPIENSGLGHYGSRNEEISLDNSRTRQLVSYNEDIFLENLRSEYYGSRQPLTKDTAY